jgi:peptidoglycan/xylan/chitin deacetylase (PgdA/CDA1 family)
MAVRAAAGLAAGVVAGGELLHLAPAAVRLRVAGRPVARGTAGHGDPGHVALTFDDGPDPGSTPHFLDALDELGVRATFFVLGEMLERSPGLGRELVTRGHEVAVHGWRHRVPWCPAPGRDLRELDRARDSVTELCGVPPVWYRPPYGVLTTGLAAAARRQGLRTVLWTAWGEDWTDRASPASVYRTVKASLTGGATLLLHDSDCTSSPGSWRAALGALPRIAEHCWELGLVVGPLRDHGLKPRA